MLVFRGGVIRTLVSSSSAASASANRAAASVFAVKARGVSTTEGRDWFFSADAAKKSGHSSLLSDVTSIYEVVTDDVVPKDWEQYVSHKGALLNMCKNRRDFSADHLASWRFIYGDEVFKTIHLFKYPNGWTDLDKTRVAKRSDAEYQKEFNSGLKLINRQTNEFVKSFSFWPVPEKRSGGNIYDVRSYTLKPGSMYDWGNYWAKGINYRKQVRADLPYAGFFSQIGKLQVVYHIWVYADLEDRNNCRKRTWNQENWPDIVTNTVPLIRSMKTRILEPLPFSPTQ